MTQHPRPWWYRLACWIVPGRVREIPEAVNPDRIVLRQIALVLHHVYLQNFASDEDPRFMHSHPFKIMIAIGLWGGYIEHRIAGAPIKRRAPYLYVLDGGRVHHVQDVTPGHTSIFVGLGRAADGSEGDKRFYGVPKDADEFKARGIVRDATPVTLSRTWAEHIVKKVVRL